MTDETDTDDKDRTHTSRKRTRMIPLVALSITGIIIVGLFATLDNWRRDLTTNFAELSDDAEDSELRPIAVPGDPNTVAQKVSDWANQQALWSLESSEIQGESIVMHLTRTTRVMRFTDDLHLQLKSVDDGTRVTAQSQSRVGKADFGQNPRNLKELVRVLSGGG